MSKNEIIKTKDNIIESINAEGFVKDLMNFIFDYGLGTYSKTDTYDAFFDTNSNFDNALLFKVSETRIKNTRQNIALKFKGEERQNVYADFLLKLHSGKIKVKFDDQETFTFFIEDPFVRMTLESLLKKSQGITADYSFNRELIKIKREDFITVLISESAEGNKDAFVKALQKEITADQIKKIGLKTLDIIEKSLNLTVLFEPIIKTALIFMKK